MSFVGSSVGNPTRRGRRCRDCAAGFDSQSDKTSRDKPRRYRIIAKLLEVDDANAG